MRLLIAVPASRLLQALAIIALLAAATAGIAAREVELRAPLTTIVRAEAPVPDGDGDLVVVADIVVPADAPRDLGVGAFVADQHGRWYQTARPGRIAPGRATLRLALTAGARGEPHRGAYDAGAQARMASGGLFLWSASPSRALLRIERLVIERTAAAAAAAHRLEDLRCDGLDADGIARGQTGSRWSLTVAASPLPENPYDPERFRLDAVVGEPDGRERRIPGFWHQPMRGVDRGDREQVVPDGAGRYTVRFRPRLPGRHQVRLEATWRDDAATHVARAPAPDLEVTGRAHDGIARVDAGDPRFFAVDGAFWWPIGINLRSVGDERCRDRLGTRLTPNRGSLSYDAYFDRLAAGGVDAVEIWLCSWNLALEWRGDWPGFQGLGRYSEENAWRLDRVLDAAWARGVRVNLVVTNHGQASERTDREWDHNPYHRAHGGRLDGAAQYFTHPWALAQQDKLRRYLAGRYADHPGLLAWKLWSEVNLTAGEQQAVRTWHETAARRWQELDTYGHPLTTHWSGDFRTPDPAIIAQTGLGFACIDAYHGPLDEGGWILAELLFMGMQQPNRGLARFAKPILVTEFGGNWNACPQPQLVAEHASAAWAAMVSGYGGAPMLWWFEWVDQGERWAPYQAVRRFLAGEDLRGADALAVEPTLSTPFGELWVRAWSRPGRMLGYILDRQWGARGGDAPTRADVRLEIGSSIAAGTIVVEWWDADRGEAIRSDRVDHPGGALAVIAPPFARHLGFKVARQ
ncbi:MAG TPA: hypothetical protein VEL07_04230 [Planctomycetota bacterium]|nr:hypothetical protein [Planctomycetota bacterium]